MPLHPPLRRARSLSGATGPTPHGSKPSRSRTKRRRPRDEPGAFVVLWRSLSIRNPRRGAGSPEAPSERLHAKPSRFTRPRPGRQSARAAQGIELSHHALHSSLCWGGELTRMRPFRMSTVRTLWPLLQFADSGAQHRNRSDEGNSCKSGTYSNEGPRDRVMYEGQREYECAAVTASSGSAPRCYRVLGPREVQPSQRTVWGFTDRQKS